MFAWRIQRTDGMFLSDELRVNWTADTAKAAEYDNVEGARREIDDECLSDCRPVVTNGRGEVVRTT